MALVTPKSLQLDLSQLQYKASHNQSRFNAEADSLPKGFPIALTTNLSWNGPTLTDESQYIHFLTNDQVLEVEAALAVFKGM